ncbi:hypothetical protein FQA47_014055 [Oryzias melastigma]|uniref:Uncharacterized protein n=1 Tax=Oryzias melastigma TaxID=30732 RepID=A0A834KZX9_ORYME|nr:hypothetical protein FQA47_014055 [Oryzias melastigma]
MHSISDCKPCFPGLISSEDGVDCKLCPAGFSCDTATGALYLCPAGQYSPEGVLQCLSCPADYVCTAGFPHKAHHLLLDKLTVKPVTTHPFYVGEPWPPAGATLSTGTYSPKEGLQRLRDCTICPAGFYCLEGSSQRPTSQFMCPLGYYCEEGTATPHGSPCPAGTAGEQLGQTSRAACKRCGEGRFCPAGVKDCLKCPPGFYCPEGTSDPIPCPPGSFNPLEGQDELADCRECIAGKACTQIALRAPDVDCMQGYVCPPGSSKPNAAVNGCPPGTFSNRTDLTDRSQCQQCPARYACLRGTGGIQRPPLFCFSGHYCPPGTMFPTQYKCPVGTWNGQGGLEDESDCQPCPRGWYCLAGSSAPTGRCNSGHYCPEGTAYGTQFPCPAGTYSIQMGNRHTEDCLECPEGSFCEQGTSKPSPCPPSTFRPLKGGQKLKDCSPCPAGYFCPHSATVSPRVCGAGSYSDEGSKECSPCLQGHYCSDETTSEEAMLSVMVCPPGFLCSQGLARDPQRSATLCPRGFYCPGGGINPNPIPCPNGTYSNSPGLRDVAECVKCPEGKYCFSKRPYEQPITKPTGECPDGHYCPPGTGHPFTYQCQAGRLQLMDRQEVCAHREATALWLQPLRSPVLLAPSATALASAALRSVPAVQRGSCFECQGGRLCNKAGLSQPLLCPVGHYCPPDSSASIPCPSGTYAEQPGGETVQHCQPCEAGSFCKKTGLSGPQGLCDPGHFCTSGAFTASPVSSHESRGLCPPSHYCPEGSDSPVPCPAGTYSNLTGQPACSRCPAGYYCPEMTGNFTKFPCPHGFYCPDGTKHATQFPCPRGYYNPEPMTQSLDSCLPCPPGHYCEKERLTKVSGKCKPGWFCVSAAWNSQPFDLDNYTNANCLCPATSTGGRCQVGFYCPLGSPEPLPCPPGTFCNLSGLALPAGPCSPGYYCTGGATGARPTDGKTGNICPPGTYCAEGSGEPQLCPPGTYSPVSALTNEASCQPCTAGFYCQEAGLISPTGPCSQGYYCDVRLGAANLSSLRPCPKGHYCPAGTALPTQHPCPIGSFNPSEHAHSQASCLPCATGHYCPSVGLSEPAGPCEAGYLCRVGASSPTPMDGFLGSVCPPGHYCPSGAVAPEVCPEGTWSNRSGLRSREDCTLCLGGFYCDSAGLTKPSGLCNAGYYCMEGAITSTPTDGVTGGPCPEGHYCPEGTVLPVTCDPGTYVTVTQATQCELCMPGWYCVSGSLYLCPAGFYCPAGTAFDLRSCPEGTYGPDPGYWSVDQCRECDGGHYCSSRNATAVSGSCQEGYYCSHGNTSVFSLSSLSPGEGGPCPVGHYCPQASILPVPCPQGTFSNLSKLVSKGDCQPCLPGYYCDAVGLSTPSGKCWEGFLCFKGANRPDPPVRDNRGGPCPKGYYCSEGSVAPQRCPLGTISTEDGRASCSACPQGFYCPGRSNDSLSASLQCPVGHYCPPGTWSKHQYPCPAGSFNPSTQQTKLQDCLPCPPVRRTNKRLLHHLQVILHLQPRLTVIHPVVISLGMFVLLVTTALKGAQSQAHVHRSNCLSHAGTFSGKSAAESEADCEACHPGSYCPSWAQTSVDLLCPQGWFCPARSVSGYQAGRQCSPGHACPPGSAKPAVCFPGTFQSSPGQSTCDSCPRGHFCSMGSIEPSPVSQLYGDVCPMGHFCPQGSESPKPCPIGTFLPEPGAFSLSHCRSCPPGQYCLTPGASQPSAAPSGQCAAGYYCPAGQSSERPEQHICTVGHYCEKVIVGQGFTVIGDPAKQIKLCVLLGSFVPMEQKTQYLALQEHSALKWAALIKRTVRPACLDTTVKMMVLPSLPCVLLDTTVQQVSFMGWSSLVLPAQCRTSLEPPTLKLVYRAQLECSALSLACRSPQVSVRLDTSVLQDQQVPTPLSTRCMHVHCCNCEGNSTINHLCPPGHYCPSGTGYPLPCPPGSLSMSQGLKTIEECPPCPPGLFCGSAAIANLSDALPCQAGFVCLGGSSSPTPSDGSHGYPCPAGYSCPVGSTVEVPCEPGTYSPAPGAGHCKLCLKGSMCPSLATQEPTTCPAGEGSFCPAGTARAQACPPGTFSNQTGAQSRSVCTPCPPGVYCSLYGATTPQGPCLEGYFCQGGAADPTPDSSADFPKNGPCPAGHYCPAGCLSPVPCPLGSVRNTSGGVSMEDCFTCPAGYYCSTEGLTSPSGPCAAGFYCPFDFSSTTPYAFICPKGHFCPEGSALAFPCPTGEYQPNPGSENCIPCRPGFYCEEAIVGEPQPCPPHSYCPAGTMVPQPCPNGTYTDSNHGGLQDESECLPCPPGKFCRAGKIQGFCAAGYLCLSGSADFHPQGPVSNMTVCQWGVQCAGPCPPGFFCPEGTQHAQMCPANTIRSSPGGVSLLDCSPCPPQYWCKPGDPLFHLCPAGHYCDGLPGSDFNGSSGPRPCPLYTYRVFPGAGSKGDCLPCPPGSNCNSTGFTNYSSTPCPPGFWCSGSGPPILCPAGTKRPLPGAATPDHCEPCEGGTFCPDPRVTGKPNVEGIPCRAAYQCPAGAALEKPCRAGSYCGPQTAEPQICPEGYICPEGSFSYNNPKQMCPFPYYCPANSSFMRSCEGGSMPVHIVGLRGSKSSCCRLCDEGFYRIHLSPNLQCLPCPLGYYCPAGTGSYKNTPCPLGYVCPMGSTQPVPCPPGTFGNITHGEKTEDCHPCPANTFNHRPAQKACFPCGSSSTSPAGSSSCTCLGKNRAFHYSDGSCLCRTGFIFYNELDFKSSLSDSELDCQPEVNRRCSTGEVRLASSRDCVSPSLHSCNVTCGKHGGTLDVEMGICRCEQYVSAEELCNTSCLSRLPQLSAQLSPDGDILLSLKERDSMLWTKRVISVLGPDIHTKVSGKTHLVQFDSDGVFGWIPSQKDVVNQFLSEPFETLRSRKRRYADDVDVDDDGALTTLPRIPNPIVCLSSGDMLIFHLTINHTDRRLSHFPVYQKDHLFNSNPNWDFGTFRHLQILMKQTNFNSSWFAHVFSEAGKYVFVDSAVPQRSMVVVVSDEGTECDPRATAFQPMTPAHLVRYGVVKHHRLNLLPDWGLILAQSSKAQLASLAPEGLEREQKLRNQLFQRVVMQLLSNSPRFPSVLLLLAKSIPSSSSASDESLLAHCSEDYYFDASNQILYLSEAKLQHVGHFIAVILQSMAHIAAGSMPQRFMQALDEAISALSLQLFNLSFKWSAAEISCIEEEIDRMSESFLQLSMQLQRRSQMSTWLKERENSAENYTRKSSASAPGLSRSGTILLELKRHLVSQRLDELKVTLDLMRRRQQHDSKLKDGAGGRTQSDSSITQQGESELVSTSDGCNSAMDQQGYKTSAD